MNMNALLKQAREMQKKVEKTRTDFEGKEFTFSGTGNAIEITMKGDLSISKITVDGNMMSADNKEIFEDLLQVTINNALKEVGKEKEEVLKTVTGGIDTGGLF